MITLKNQTIYQCEHCRKRLLSKNGAKIHENEYCSHPESPNNVKRRVKQENCEHENTETIYGYIPGEAVQQPEYELCIDCDSG